MFERIIDPRIEQVRKIVETLVSKKLFFRTNVLVKGDNVTIIVDNTAMFSVPLKGVEPNIYQDISFNYVDIYEFENPNECINNVILARQIFDTKSYYTNCLSGNLVAKENDARNNPEFERLLNLKAAEGMKFYKIKSLDFSKDYLIPIFSGFPNMNKQDDVSIEVYQTIDRFLVVRMIISKKKISRDVDMIFRILQIN